MVLLLHWWLMANPLEIKFDVCIVLVIIFLPLAQRQAKFMLE
jgi:hypothetical protein